jgi:hypothetical protein
MEDFMPAQHNRAVWTKITNAYQQWDQDRSSLMSIDELYERLPDVDRELIGETLAAARSEGKVDAPDTNTFRPIPNH